MTDVPRLAGIHRRIDTPSGRRMAIMFVGVWIILVIMRLPFAWTALHRNLYNIDELDLTLGAFDRFLGVPLANTHWPAILNQICIEGLMCLKYAWHSRGHPSPTDFFEFLSANYRQPWQGLFLARMVVVVVESAGLAVLSLQLAKSLRSVAAAAILILLLGTVPEIWYYGVLVAGNGMSIGLMAIATAAAIGEWKGETKTRLMQPLLVGVLAGLALASRNTMLPYVLFLGAMLVRRSPRPWSALAVFMMSTCVVVFFVCAPVWLDPIRFFKANLGNYRKTGAPTGLAGAVRVLLSAAPGWLVLSGGAGTAWAIRKGERVLAAGAILCVGAMVLLAARAPEVETRYFHSAILALWTMTAWVLGPLLTAALVGTAFWKWTGASCCAAAIIINSTGIRPKFRPVVAPVTQVEGLRAKLAAAGGKTIAVPVAYLPYIGDLASSESLAAMEASCTEAIAQGSVADYLKQYKFSPEIAKVMASNFNEKEVAFAARLRVMMVDRQEKSVRLILYAPKEVAARFGLETEAGALAKLDSGLIQAIVVPDADVAPDQRGESVGEGLTLIARASQSSPATEK